MKLSRRFVWYVLAGLFWPAAMFAQTLFLDDFSNTVPGLPPSSTTWRVINGVWLADSGHVCETSGDYDNGLMLPIWIDVSFEITARCRFPADQAGAGFFLFSESFDGTDYAQMLRLDGRQVLMGYFLNGSYQATRVAESPVNVLDSAWHELRLRVDLNTRTYAFFVDGQPVGDPEPLTWASGYVGLQNSGGHACFDDVRLRRLEAGHSRDALAWPRAVAVTPSGDIWVAEPGRGEVRRIDAQGREMDRLYAEEPARPTARDWRPLKLAAVGETLAVLDTLNHRVHLFHRRGRWRRSLPPVVKRPIDIAAVPAEEPLLAVTDGRVVRFFDPDGKAAGGFSRPDWQVTAMAFRRDRLAVVDGKRLQVRLFGGRAPEYRETAAFTAPPGPIRDLLWVGERLWLLVGQRIERYDSAGHRLARLDLQTHAPVILPAQMALHDGQVIIADALNNRLLLLPAGMSAWPEPRLQWQAGELRVGFRAPSGVEPVLKIADRRSGAATPGADVAQSRRAAGPGADSPAGHVAAVSLRPAGAQFAGRPSAHGPAVLDGTAAARQDAIHGTGRPRHPVYQCH
ncbi:MAG: hypothetical protein Q9P14_12025 [candidate division KSB1 bacterium]|nr:hypothetical protein [candidate division KSB1 bacterium]